MIRIALDAMGGDNAPESCLEGALDALAADSGLQLVLAGPEALLREKLAGKTWPEDRLLFCDAAEVISPEESPVAAIRSKKDSSLVRGIRLVKEGDCGAFVSAGSTGAVLAAGQLLIGRVKGVQRPPLAMLIPSGKGVSLFLDAGANVDAKPDWLWQFARMGSIYMKTVQGIAAPTVKLLNIGLESEKGNALTRETDQLLRADSSLNYQGYAESREVPYGTADVIVTDAFTGNMVLKMYEGTAGCLMKTLKQVMMGSLRTKLGALLIKKDLKTALKVYDASEYGGAPLLGLKGCVIKCHGNAGRSEICHALCQASACVRGGVNELIAKAMEMV